MLSTHSRDCLMLAALMMSVTLSSAVGTTDATLAAGLLLFAAAKREQRFGVVPEPPPPSTGVPADGLPYGRLILQSDGVTVKDQYWVAGANGEPGGNDLLWTAPDRFLDTEMPDTTGWPVYPCANQTAVNDAVAAAHSANPDLPRCVIEWTGGDSAVGLRLPNRSFNTLGVRHARADSLVVIRPQTIPTGFPEPGEAGACWKVKAVDDELPTFTNSVSQGAALMCREPDSELTDASPDSGKYVFHYRVIGFRFASSGTGNLYARVNMGWATHGVELDRCIGTGDLSSRWTQAARTVQMMGSDNALLDGWYDGARSLGEAQAVTVAGGTAADRAAKIVGCYMSGTGVPMFVGGWESTPTGYTLSQVQPQNVEVRRCFWHRPMNMNECHPYFGSEGDLVRGTFTVTSWTPGTHTLVCSDGAFDAAETQDATGGNHYYMAVIVDGPRAGGWAKIVTRSSATTVVVHSNLSDINRWHNGEPQAGDTIEVRYAYQWDCKGLFEVKDGSRILVVDCEGQGSWYGATTQYRAIVLKSAGLGDWDERFSRDVTMRRVRLWGILSTLGVQSGYAENEGPGYRMDIADLFSYAMPLEHTPAWAGATWEHIFVTGDYVGLRRMTRVGYTYRQHLKGDVYGLGGPGPTALNDAWTIRQLLTPQSDFGLFGGDSGGGGKGDVALAGYCTDPVWEDNYVWGVGATTSDWPTGTTAVDAAEATLFSNPTADPFTADYSINGAHALAALTADEKPGARYDVLLLSLDGVRVPDAVIPVEV